MTFSFPLRDKKIELPNHQKLFQKQYGVRNCFPTPVLADRSRGQVLPFSTCSGPSQTHINLIQLKTKRGRFCLLNYTVVPLLA